MLFVLSGSQPLGVSVPSKLQGAIDYQVEYPFPRAQLGANGLPAHASSNNLIRRIHMASNPIDLAGGTPCLLIGPVH